MTKLIGPKRFVCCLRNRTITIFDKILLQMWKLSCFLNCIERYSFSNSFVFWKHKIHFGNIIIIIIIHLWWRKDRNNISQSNFFLCSFSFFDLFKINWVGGISFYMYFELENIQLPVLHLIFSYYREKFIEIKKKENS